MRRWCFGLLCILVVATASASETLSSDERRMAEWVDAHTEDAIALLAETVNIPSGSMNLDGVRAAGRVMDRAPKAIGLAPLLPAIKRAAILIYRLSIQSQGD